MRNLTTTKLPKIRLPYNLDGYENLINIVEKENLKTVCQEANCPNIFDCFSKGTLTFMILGSICTRNCLYCNVKTGKPLPPDKNEPKKIADIIKKLKLDYAVITCVTRDDLNDGGAGVFAEAVKEIKKINPVRSPSDGASDGSPNKKSGLTSNGVNPKCNVELLISDLNANGAALKTIIDANAEVIGHNVEVVKRLFPILRPQGNYERTIELLGNIKKYDSEIITKSGFMVGLGENEKEIIQTMKDIKDANCDIITIGQYLAPSKNHASVEKFYSMEEFAFFKQIGESLGFECIESGPLVRSSFNARDSYEKARRKTCKVS